MIRKSVLGSSGSNVGIVNYDAHNGPERICSLPTLKEDPEGSARQVTSLAYLQSYRLVSSQEAYNHSCLLQIGRASENLVLYVRLSSMES